MFSGIKKRIGLLILIAATILGGCKSYEYFTIDVMEPAELFLPATLNTLLVTHNAHRDTTNNQGTRFTIFSERLTDTVFRDPGLADTALATLQDMLNQIGRFETIINDSAGLGLPRETDQYTQQHIAQIKSLSAKTKADAVLIFSLLDKSISYDIYYGDFGSTFGEFEAIFSSQWLLINPYTAKLIDQKTIRDTFYLPVSNPYSQSDASNYRQSIQLLTDAAIESAIQFAAHLSPHYAQTERLIFSKGDKTIKKGYESATQGDWKIAAAHWRDGLTKKDNKVRAKACFNLALSSEMEGLLEPALEWAQQSYSFFPDTLNATYINILEERNKKQKDILLQMEGENGDF
jgi:hypothetical protein